jgi:hypothetical protein
MAGTSQKGEVVRFPRELVGRTVVREKRAEIITVREWKRKRAGELRQEKKAADQRGHAAMRYLRMLLENDHVSRLEGSLVERAIAPLVEHIPNLTIDDVEAVRAEFGLDKKATKNDIARQEEALWLKSPTRNLCKLPGFDFDKAHALFMTDDPSHFHHSLLPFESDDIMEEQAPDGPYVPYHLRSGELFFFVILRMFRKRFELRRA